jgi:translation initiation factor 2B subunit (eIF-2B alpha/beta/delta family)
MGRLFDQVLTAVRDTRPKLIALIDLLIMARGELVPHFQSDDAEEVRAHAIRILEDKIALYEARAAAVTRRGLEHVSDGDRILVHSVSSVVTNILVGATRTLGRSFQVLVLQHDPVRTPQVAQSLAEEGIPHRVIPVHDLCHYQHEVDKLFLGALTVTPDRKIIAPVGTASVVSICRLAGIRSYLFANTLHYSTGVASTQQIHLTSTEVEEAESSYELTSHSHDLVDLALIDVIVNEHGVTPLEVIGTERARQPR